MEDTTNIYSNSPLLRGDTEGFRKVENTTKLNIKNNNINCFEGRSLTQIPLTPNASDFIFDFVKGELWKNPSGKTRSINRYKNILVLLLTLFLLPISANTQHFKIFDVDKSDYPTMQAKFYSIDGNGNQILDHTAADFDITENGDPRNVLSVNCPEIQNSPISVVIAIDVSGSMSGKRISLAKEAARSWVEGMPENGSECAIVSFTSGNNFIQDFTTNKSQLLNKINNLSAGGGTDFNAAFTKTMAGALLTMDYAKHNKKAIILVTDGIARGNEAEIINKSNSIGSLVYSVTLDMRCPDILKNISEQTNGEWFENVTTTQQAKDVFQIISGKVYNSVPCTLKWESEYFCESGNIDILVNNNVLNLSSEESYSISSENNSNLKIEPSFVNFEGVEPSTVKDTVVKVTSRNIDAEITDIELIYGSEVYQIDANYPIQLQADIPKTINISFLPPDSLKQYATFEIKTNKCNNTFSVFGGYKNQSVSKETIKLTHPNGGELFYAGSDTVITWEGISKNDKVSLDFSSDNGKSWRNITKSASNNLFEWLVPYVESDSCLVKVKQLDKNSIGEGNSGWKKSFGGSDIEWAKSIDRTFDNGYLIGGYANSIDGDLSTNRGESDFWIIKIDAGGNLLWENSLGGSSIDELRSIVHTFDGGCVAAGITGSNDGDVKGNPGGWDVWIVKLDVSGNYKWSNTIGGNGYDDVHSIQQTVDGGFILAGASEKQGNNGGMDVWVVKLDNKGKEEWSFSYGGSNNEIAYSIKETDDGGFVAAGRSESSDKDVSNNKGKSDFWIIKLDANGVLQWKESYGGSENETAYSIVQSDEGGYLVAGSSRSSDGDLSINRGETDVWIVKLNENGGLDWERTYGGSKVDDINSVIQTIEGDYIVVGSSYSKDGDISNSNGGSDVWIIKFDEAGDIKWERTYGGSKDDIASSIVKAVDGGYVTAGVSYSSDKDITDFKGGADFWVIKFDEETVLQSDESDAVFSIIAPEPRIAEDDIDLGQMVVGKMKDTTVFEVICNDGEAPLHVLDVEITSGDQNDYFLAQGAGEFTLNENQCRDFMIEFIPSEVGNRVAYATIRTTIGDFQDTITIRGEGINPKVKALADVIDFGKHELGNSKDTNVYIIKNLGTRSITINDTEITGPNKEQFEILSNDLSFTISPDEEHPIDLRYTAKYGGRVTTDLEFEFDGVDSPVKAVLYAEGIGGEVYPEIEDGYAGEVKDLKLQLGRIKPEGITEIASTFTATVKFNSTLIAPLDKSMFVEIDDENRTVLEVEGSLSNNTLLTSIPVKIGLGNSIKTSIIVSEFHLFDENGDEVFYDIEPGIGEFNLLGICEEGGTRLINPNGKVSLDPPAPNMTSYQTEIRFETIESGHTKLEVYNFLGSKVATIINGDIEPGRREMTLDLSNFATGRYYIQLSTPTVTKTEILEVVK